LGLEIEAKLAVASHEPVRRALARQRAEPLGRVLETNHILDTAEGTLRSAGTALRLRVNEPVDGGPPRAILTYKGPVQPGSLKRRDEIEVSVADAVTALDLLAALGFVLVLVYRKRRESYRLADCRVELDEVPFAGCFVEIEGPTEQAVAAGQARIGLADVPHEPGTYVDMLMDHCARTGTDPLRVDFPAS
jgi:predicted adenylyl cyclase CyaB